MFFARQSFKRLIKCFFHETSSHYLGERRFLSGAWEFPAVTAQGVAFSLQARFLRKAESNDSCCLGVFKTVWVEVLTDTSPPIALVCSGCPMYGNRRRFRDLALWV